MKKWCIVRIVLRQLKDCQITLTKKTKRAAKARKQTPESFNWKKILVEYKIAVVLKPLQLMSVLIAIC